MYQNGTFAPCNKHLARKWHEHQLKKHTHRVRHVKGSLDLTPPKQYPHLEMRLKKIQMEEDRQALVDKHNQLLLNKLTDIMSKPGRIDHWNNYQQKRRHSIDVPAFSLNQPARQRALAKIVEENRRLAFKLENAKPSINAKDMQKSYKKHMKVKRMLATGDKDFPRQNNYHQNTFYDYGGKKDGNYSDSWESLSEDENTDKNKRNRTPSVASQNGFQDQRNKQDDNKTSNNRNAKVPRFPQIKDKPKTVEKDAKKTQADLDAKQLFKAVKHLADPEETLLKHLAKRSYIQRIQIADKFSYLYDLELGEELKECLGSKYFVLVDALLQESDSKSHVENAEKLNSAIDSEKIDDIISILISQGKHELTSLKNTYKREFNHTVEEDIEDLIRNKDVRNLITILAQKDIKNADPDSTLAEKDAKEIYEADEDSWSSESGKLLKVIKLRSYMQILLTFDTYLDVSNGHTIADTVAAECSDEYASAISSLGTQIKAINHSKAADLFKALNKPDGGKLFISLLLKASEGDMPAVKQSYREKYKVEMTDSILATYKSQLGRILIEIAHKSGPVSTQQKKQQGTKRMGGMTINPPKQQKPLAKPKQQSVQQDKNHPLNAPVSKKKSNPAKDANRLDDTYGEADTAVRRLAEKENVVKEATFDEAEEEKIPDDDCKRIYDAMQGLGIDEDTITNILSSRSSRERLELKKLYKDRYKQDLLEDLKSELSADFTELLTGLLTERIDFTAGVIYNELNGARYNESHIIGMIFSKTPQQLTEIISRYKETYKSDLQSDIERKSSRLVSGLFESYGQNSGRSVFDEEQAETDAQEIYEELMEGNFDTVIKVLSSSNSEQINATATEYEKLTDNSLADELEKSFRTSEKTAFLSISKLTEDVNSFFAEQLQSAIREVGKKERFMQIFVQHMEDDLSAIGRKYEDEYGVSLRTAIDDDVSGNNKNMLKKLL